MKFWNQAKKYVKKAVGYGSALVATAMVAPAAMATAPSISGQVISTINTYKEEALLIIVAFILVLWAIRSTGILKPKG